MDELDKLAKLSACVYEATAYADIVAIVPIISIEKQRHSWRVYMVQEQDEYVATCTITTHKGCLRVTEPVAIEVCAKTIRRIGATYRELCEEITEVMALSVV